MKKLMTFTYEIRSNASNNDNLKVQHQRFFCDRRRNQLSLLLFILILLFSGVTTRFLETNEVNAQELQKGISKEIIRFHVIANSDSDEDQALKYKVKDILVNELSPELKDAKNIIESREILIKKLSDIQFTAESILQENGYSYPVKVSLEPCYFPLKVYGNFSFPPGTYEALRVQIGEAKGQNWWCVMFPPLCFVDESYSIVDEETDKQLKHMLSEDEYKSLKNEKIPVKIKFKLLDSLKKLFIN